MGKAQAMRGAAAAEEGDLQEEASHSHSSAMCRRKSCGGTIRAERARTAWPRPQGRSRGRGRRAGGEGSRLLRSEHAAGSGGGKPRRPRSSQAGSRGRHAPVCNPASTEREER